MPTGGELVASSLRAHGVSTVFCVPGESYLPLLDALYDHSNEIKVIQTRHEHGAAVMAEATGKLTGTPGVCMVTRGPGACNASIGVHTAHQDSTPMILLVGQVPRSMLGREAFQEADIAAAFRPMAKDTIQVTRTEDLPDIMSKAFYVARTGRPGPVVVALPSDVLYANADVADVAPYTVPDVEPDPGDMERLNRMLRDAERPLVIVGGSGWTSSAREDFLEFVTANALPVCCAFRRHDVVDNRSPNFVGELGLGCDPALVARAKAADLVVAVGTRLGEIPTIGYTLFEAASSDQALVHVHPDPRALSRQRTPDLTVTASMESFARTALSMPSTGSEVRFDWAASARGDFETNRAESSSTSEPDLAGMMRYLDAEVPDDAVVTVDAGNFSGWPQRYLTFGGGRRLLGAANGAMGYGVPAAVATSIADPHRTVIACVGDGGFGMTGLELATASARGASVKVLVFDNGMYGTIRMHQQRHYPDRVIGTGLQCLDAVQVARGCGAQAESVSLTDQFASALSRTLTAEGSALIHIAMDPDVITTRTRLSELQTV